MNRNLYHSLPYNDSISFFSEVKDLISDSETADVASVNFRVGLPRI